MIRMTLVVQSEQRKCLDLLADQPVKALNDLIPKILKLDFTSSDDNLTAASKALLKLFIDARKLKLSGNDFESQLKATTPLKAEQIKSIGEFYTKDSSVDELITSNELSFRDLEWRLEAKVSSRFLHSPPPEPKIAIKIHLDQEKSLNHRQMLKESDSTSQTKKELVLQTDVNSLVHIIDQLESAKNAISLRKVRAPVQS